MITYLTALWSPISMKGNLILERRKLMYARMYIKTLHWHFIHVCIHLRPRCLSISLTGMIQNGSPLLLLDVWLGIFAYCNMRNTRSCMPYKRPLVIISYTCTHEEIYWSLTLSLEFSLAIHSDRNITVVKQT